MTATIVEAALRALLFAVGVGVGLRVLRVSNVPVRKAAWSLVLVASLAMPFVMRWTATASWANRFGVALAWPTKRAVVEPTPPQAQPLPRVILASDTAAGRGSCSDAREAGARRRSCRAGSDGSRHSCRHSACSDSGPQADSLTAGENAGGLDLSRGQRASAAAAAVGPRDGDQDLGDGRAGFAAGCAGAECTRERRRFHRR